MSTAMELLDKALDSAREELRLLKRGDEEGALRLARDRDLLVRESWELRDASVEQSMREALERLRQLHEGIVGEARRQRDKVRDELRRIRGKRKCNAGYGAQRRKSDIGVPRFVNKKS